MNKKFIILIISAFTILLVGLMGMLLYSSAEDSVPMDFSQYITITGPSIVSGESDPNSYPYNIGCPEFEATSHNGWMIPTYGGFQIFCIEPGAQLRYADATITYKEAKELEGKEYTKEHTKNNGHADKPRNLEKTLPVFFPKYVGTLSPAAAYIVSDPYGSWEEKQKGLWNLRNTGNDGGLIIGDGKSAHDGPSIYDVVANDYADFDSKVRDIGLQPEYTGDLENVYIKVDQTTTEYTVGPFNVSYTNGIYGDTTFGGISNMIVYGYNKKGELVNDNIIIDKILLKDTTTGEYGSAVMPEYFEPDSASKIDTTPQVYPAPNQDFQIVFQDPNVGLSDNDEDRVAYITIKVQFKYMLADGMYLVLEGIKFQVTYKEEHTNYHCEGHGIDQNKDGVDDDYVDLGDNCCSTCKTTCVLKQYGQQDIIAADAIRTLYEQEISIDLKFETNMDLGGHVWEDALAGKETAADGFSNTEGDIPLENVKVTLYTSDGEIATLLSDPDEEGISNETLMHRINPTYTDEDGNYLFEGLDPMKDYYVTFEYNGQVYLPTEYLNVRTEDGTELDSVSQMVNAGLYNTDSWKITSKGTEATSSVINGVEISRDDFDNRFSEIASYPENYTSSNSLGVVGNTNAVYTQLDLMGYTLNENGNYEQTGTQLIDGYTYDSRGLQTDNYTQGIISTRVREYIAQNHQFPNEEAMRTIYQNIAGNNTETWRMLQFIEDCYIQAYTGSPTTQDIDIYPVYDQFIINRADNFEEYETAEEAQNGSYDMTVITLDGVTYNPIYPGQFFVNLGLWRRQEFDASLRKDAYKAALKINDKTIVYNYEKRDSQDGEGTNSANGQDNNTYWDINVRMSDYEGYYNTGYNRELYNTDYLFNTSGGLAEGHPGDPLEVYVTYKITIRNQSMSIMTQIKEIVDYYDQDYTFKPNLSWAMYQTQENYDTSVDEDEYYEMMEQAQESLDNGTTSALNYITNSKDAKVTEDQSRYGNEKNLGSQYQNLYIRALEDKKLETGETAYIYLTFEVNKDSNGRVILDNESSPKENLAEINGYSTYYGDGTQLPNGVTKNSSNIAGLLDRDSNPGNLVADDLQGERYERNFEDDTDRAPSLRLLIDEEAIREANGIVWEDKRDATIGDTSDSADALVGDGIRQEEEIGIEGVTVELVEKCVDGKERVWYRATTGKNGGYNFASFIPGDYIIRFQYGDTDATVLTEADGGANLVSYNGQDFKSTTYQTGIDENGNSSGLAQNANTDLSGNYHGYTNTATQNETGTYGYDIYVADSNSNNYSDAKDIWSRRAEVNNYSTNNITNHVAEVLASPYETPSYNGNSYSDEEMRNLWNELRDNTRMTAETGVIVVEFEYDRQQSDGLKETQNNASNSSKDYVGDNQYNSNYTLNNVDLGLTERPKAQLEIDKSVANVEVTLANGTILFDINEAANNAIWQDHDEYSIDEEKINDQDRGIDFENGEIGMYEEYYAEEERHRYSFREEIDNIVRTTDKGLIQLTMDQELMHGATIQVTYTVKITNVGEVDYVDGNNKNFYYRGDTTGASISTTTANQVVDYVANNLQFDSNNATNSEDGWSVITAETLTGSDLVNSRLAEQLAQFNTIIQTEDFGNEDGEALVPGQEISKTVILSQLITPENTEDDLTYNNMVEIAKTSNTAGRRMAYSVVGNQNPTASDASEVDSNVAERIIILPPFGIGETIVYAIIGVVVAAMLIVGIIFIRKKVLTGRNN